MVCDAVIVILNAHRHVDMEIDVVEKNVVLSSMLITDTNTVGTPTLKFTCYNNADPTTNVVDITINSIPTSNNWYVLEQSIYSWDQTKGSQIVCSLESTKADGYYTTPMGSTQIINYDDITTAGLKVDTSNPAESSFYLRCGNCYPPLGVLGGPALNKTIGLKSIQVSDTHSTFSNPSIYVQCAIAGTSSIFEADTSDVTVKDREFTVDKSFGWIWNNGTMLNAGTCGVFIKATDNDDALGTVIVHFEDITVDGFQYTMPNDASTLITLYDCQGMCSNGGLLLVNIALILCAILLS